MGTNTVILVVVIYFAIMMLVSYLTSRKASQQAFFTADRSSRWYMVAFGMIGASLSAMTFVSVPGGVGLDLADTSAPKGFAYLQLVMGFAVGYWVVARVLLPVYYRLGLISIYAYLGERFGRVSYRTGSLFFLISRTVGASLRLLLVAGVFEVFLFDDLGLPFWAEELVTIMLVWLYTFRGGIKTIIWTDVLQTLVMLIAVVVTIRELTGLLGYSGLAWIGAIGESRYGQLFFWDWQGSQFFPKQFISGVFITITMTGLDQDMMQKNLTCRSLPEAQKNMISLGLALIPVNLMFLALGALLYLFADSQGISAVGDELYPFIAKYHLGFVGALLFLVGIIAAGYSSADSALTSLTTAVCVDFLGHGQSGDEQAQSRQRFWVHIGLSVLLFVVVLGFSKEKDALNRLFVLAGYTYGPLLGMFAFGLYAPWKVRDRWVPVVCFGAIGLAFGFQTLISIATHYQFGYELLLFNGLLTYLGLWLIRLPTDRFAYAPAEMGRD